MDFFQRNMDTIKGKFPQMPHVPKLPKLKTRKIFNTSRDNISQYEDTQHSKNSSMQLPCPSGAVNLTPVRIGTISSLVDGAEQSNFNIPEEFNGRSPMGGRRRIRFSDSNLSGINEMGFSRDNLQQPQQQQQQQSASSSGSGTTTKTRFTERLTKQYKELSEFKLSNLFGKKTVVRKTEIEVNTYLHGFEQSSDGIDNRNYNHDEARYGSSMDIGNSRDVSNRKRRISEVSNFSVDITILPSGSEPSPIPKPKAALKMPPIPMTPENKPIIVSSLKEEPLEIEQIVLNTQEETPIIAPLVKRKIFASDEPESIESVNIIEGDESQGSAPTCRSVKIERKPSTKSRKSISSNPESPRSRHGSQKSRGMWELKRPIRIKATPEDFKNPVDANTLDATPDFRKALANVFKKFQSNNATAMDESEESPKPSALQKMQRSVRNKTRPEASDTEEESEFKKQFNKIKSNTEKLKNFIKNDTENVVTTYSAPTSPGVNASIADTEDPAKVKSLDEIERLGYGRKNLKYIEKWRIRRRREIRRNEPFPVTKSDDLENENKDRDTFNDNEKETTEASQLNELKKSLAKVLKKRHLAREISTDSATGDEQHQEQPSTRKAFGGLFSKQPIKTSPSVEDNLDEGGSEIAYQKPPETEQKLPFWKKRSVKNKMSTEDLSKSSENILSDGEDVDRKQEPHKKVSLLDKAKSKVEKLKAMKKPSLETNEPEKAIEKSKKPATESPVHEEYLDELEDVDEETAKAIEEMERNASKQEFKSPVSIWQTSKINTGGEFSSGSEESITTPGFLAHENAPDSETYVSSEPTVIILSGPMPALMTLPSRVPSDLRHLYPNLNSDIEENVVDMFRPSSPTPYQNDSNMEFLSSSNPTSTRSPAPTETLKDSCQVLNFSSPSTSISTTPVSDYYSRPRSSSPVCYKFNDAMADSPTPPRSNLIKSAGFHDLASASWSSSFESPVLGRRDYQSSTQPPSLSPSAFIRSSSSTLHPPKGSPPPLPPCSPPPLLELPTQIYPDFPSEFEDALGINSEMLQSHKFNFKSETLQIILESPLSATNSIDVVELSIESPTTPPFSTPIQSPPVPKRTTPSPQLIESPVARINSPICKVWSQNENSKVESNFNAVPRPRHSRKPSMDKPPPIEPTSVAVRNSRSPIIGLNKIEENQLRTQIGPDNVKKWSSVDIFNGNNAVFNDFDEELKNVPIIPISFEDRETFLNVANNNSRQYNSMSPRLEKSSDLLIDEINSDSEEEEFNTDESKLPIEAPVVPERPKPSRPVVKQASMRRQFSDEKDAEDLNKNIDVNKLRSKFENTNLPPRPPERLSFRKYEKIQVTTVMDNNQNEKSSVDNIKPDEFIIRKTIKPSSSAASTPEKLAPLPSAPPPLLPRKSKLKKQPSSLEVETDGSDNCADVYEPIQDFVGRSQNQQQQQQQRQQINNNDDETISITSDVQLTSTATLKAIQAKQQYEANLKAEKLIAKEETLLSSESSLASTASSATSTLSAINVTNVTTPIVTITTISSTEKDEMENEDVIDIGKSSTTRILQHQQQHKWNQEFEQEQHQQLLQKDQMSLLLKQKEKEMNPNRAISTAMSKINLTADSIEPQSINVATTTKIETPTIMTTKMLQAITTNTNSDIQPDVGNIPTTTTAAVCDEGYYYSNNERIRISDLKKDEMFYSLDDEEYQQYSLSGPTIVKELYTIEI